MDLEAKESQLLPKLRERLKGSAELSLIRSDDEFLLKFLRVRDFDPERAAVAVKNYCRYIQKNQDRLSGIRPSDFLEIYQAKISMFLKRRCRNGSKVALIRTGTWNTRQWTFRVLQQADVLPIEQALLKKDTQLNGLSVIFDFQGLSLSHVTAITPMELKSMITSIQDGFPVKMVGIHFLNYPAIFWGLFYIAQRFLKEKLRKRIHFHANQESLSEYFYPEGLPKCVGGLLELDEAHDKENLQELIRKNLVYEDYYRPRVNVTTTAITTDT